MNFSGMLLDSDVLAEIRKADPDPAVVAFLRRRSFRHMYISVLSIGELKCTPTRKLIAGLPNFLSALATTLLMWMRA